MAVLNRNYRFLFLGEPYSASRAVRDALLTVEGSENVGHHHATLDELRRTVNVGSNVLTFAVARNPLDRLVTEYHHMTGWHEQGFEAFVRDRIKKGRIYYHLNSVHQWLYYDKLDPSLHGLVFRRCGVSLILNTVGATKGKQPWQTYYTESLAHEVVNRLMEFQLFPRFRDALNAF